jgi:hypothetical protein
MTAAIALARPPTPSASELHPTHEASGTAAERPCFGVACPYRGTCGRYLAVDTAPADARRQGTCIRSGQFLDYLPAPAGR